MRLLKTELLSPLAQKVARSLIDELEGLLAKAAGEVPDGAAARCECMVRGLLAVCRELQDWRDETEARYAQLTHALAAARDKADVRDLLLEFFAWLDPDPARLRGDRAAFARFMGADVASERMHMKLGRLSSLMALAAEFLGHSAAELLRLNCLAGPAVGKVPAWPPILGEVEVFALQHLHVESRWQGRVAVLNALARLAAELPEPSRLSSFAVPLIARITTLALDPLENVWVQGSALDLLYLLRPEEGRSGARRRLLAPADSLPDDFFVRKHAVDLLARDGAPEALEVLAGAVSQPDPSPFVRGSLLGALGRCEAGRQRMLLGRVLLQPGLETVPQVRARAVIALAACAAQDPPGCHVRHVVHILARCIGTDPSPMVRTVAMEEAAALLAARRNDGRATAVDELDRPFLQALDALSEDEAQPADLRRAAARAREAVLVTTLTAYRPLMAALPAIIRSLPSGQRRRLPRKLLQQLDTDEIGRVLAHLSRDGFGLALQHDLFGWWLHKGDVLGPALWRVWHELRNPSPEKRKGFDHTLGRAPAGVIRAPSCVLAELTMTKVPGERVFDDTEGQWRRYLPTVDDYLSLVSGGLRCREVKIFSDEGVTTLRAPRGLFRRPWAYLGISFGYARLAELRAATSGVLRPAMADRYVREFDQRWGFVTHFEPHAYSFAGRRWQAHDPCLDRVFANGRAPRPCEATADDRVLALSMAFPVWLDSDYFLSPQGNHISHLVLFAAAVLLLLLVRECYLFRSLRRARRSLPLVLGGWGTRGKSGSERLKAALFHGLGLSVFAKTTGCEAMFIHSAPGLDPAECFLFRPYDHVSLWEMRDVMRMASGLRADVFLWECMALRPEMVRMLQRDWVGDDLSTLTNAFPDHVDLQGPAGVDIPEVMKNFMSRGRTLLTAETQMLPVLQEGAAALGCDLHAIASREADLLTPDLLDRFPYKEHPKNIALVAGLARHLGIESDFALKEMADNVVPDLGVLKLYPQAGFQVTYRGRTLQFANGMSANERRGTIENWRRLGFDRHDLEDEPFVYLVTVVNNRADRVSRSVDFADVIVHDLQADCHVAIGTNLTGLAGYIERSMTRRLNGLELVPLPYRSAFRPKPLGQEVLAEWHRLLRRMRVRSTSVASVLRTLKQMLVGVGLELEQAGEAIEAAGLAAAIEHEVTPASDRTQRGASGEAAPELKPALAALRERLAGRCAPELTAEMERFLEADVRRLARLLEFEQRLASAGVGSGKPVDWTTIRRLNEDCRRVMRELFREQIRVLGDEQASGDAVVDFVVRQVPPGMDVRLMGIQNIKGTGLDFVYRWVSVDKVCRMIGLLGNRSPAVRLEAAEHLSSYMGYGLLDTPLALKAIEEARKRPENQRFKLQELLDRAQQHARARLAEAQRALEVCSEPSRFGMLLRWIEHLVDFADSWRRRRQADAVFRDLIASRISHRRAAVELARLTERQKGGWLEDGLSQLLKRFRSRNAGTAARGEFGAP